jgi:hypothetical protein
MFIRLNSPPFSIFRHLAMGIGLWVTLTALGVAALPAGSPFTTRVRDGSVEIENGLLMARFSPGTGGMKQQLHARNRADEWFLVVESLHPWYGRTLGRQDLLDRGVAATRSSVVLINQPRHLANGIYRHPNLYPLGLGPENIDHEGHPQSAMRTSPSWGEGSGGFTGLAGILRELEGAYVDLARDLAVGVDGIEITRVQLRNGILELDLGSQLARLEEPWDEPYQANLLLAGLPMDQETMLSLNHGPATALPAASACLIPLTVHPNGHIDVAADAAVKSIQHPR